MSWNQPLYKISLEAFLCDLKVYNKSVLRKTRNNQVESSYYISSDEQL